MSKLVYRPVGDVGAYPDWLRALKGKSGAYVIRERGLLASEVVYVGESHSARLYQTITRHFQQWRRSKSWWAFQFGPSHDPGVTYDRGAVEVAVRVTPARRAVEEQAVLMRRLRPRDNMIGWPADVGEAVPF